MSYVSNTSMESKTYLAIINRKYFSSPILLLYILWFFSISAYKYDKVVKVTKRIILLLQVNVIIIDKVGVWCIYINLMI